MPESSNKKFVDEMANPYSWLLTADDLHEQAVSLYAGRGRGGLILQRPGSDDITWDRVNRSVFLLGGFALENAIKAFLVYDNPQWVSNGTLSKQLRSHSLTKLQKQSKSIPLKQTLLWVLGDFEDGLESWARYPCGLNAISSRHQGLLDEELWAGYLRIMEAYGRKMKALLIKGWSGPNGFNGRWTFTGEFLTSDGPSQRRARRVG